MDLQSGMQILLDYYGQNDIFCLETDYKKLNLNLLKQNTDDLLPQQWEIELALKAAIQDMISEEFVRPVESGSGKNKQINYVILNSIKNNGCILELSKESCQNISNVVNSLLPMFDLDIEQQSDPKNICEADIQVLLHALNIMSKQLDEVQNKNNKDKDKDNTELN